MDKQNEIGVEDPVEIHFSNPLLLGDLEPKIEISPSADFDYTWSDAGRKLKIIPGENWKASKNYFVKIKDVKNLFLIRDSISLSFSTIDLPKVQSFYPEKDAKNVTIDIEDPLRVVFDRSLDNFNIKFEVSPRRVIGYKLDGDKKIIHFVFKDGYEKGRKYEIKLYAKTKEDESEKYQVIYETNFETEPPVIEEWSKDYESRISQAKKFTKAKIREGKYIDINLGIQIMTIFENGEVLDSFLISSGKRGMDTPKGQFEVSNKHPRPWSKTYGLYMPYWMAIVSSGKFGIHELPEWPGGYKEGQNHLGTPVSHGCVRLGIGAAKKVYDWADIGTPIIIY
ncbi:MAG: L,D-transpeptidase family protein [Candidatus Moranbacteria bacterium]|nr:L,D-transpeptidase family protein [Candidatus Moranbacteria bacterium]